MPRTVRYQTYCGEQDRRADLMAALGMALCPREGISVSSNRNPTPYCLQNRGNVRTYMFIKARANTARTRGLLNHTLQGRGSFYLYASTYRAGLTPSLASLQVPKGHSCSWGTRLPCLHPAGKKEHLCPGIHTEGSIHSRVKSVCAVLIPMAGLTV